MWLYRDVHFRSWQLYDVFVQAVDAGAVTAKSESQKPRIRLTVDDQTLFVTGIRVHFSALSFLFFSCLCFCLQGEPSIDSLADSIESAWNSGEFKRAVTLFNSAHRISSSEFRNSFRLVALLTEYLSSAKLHREGLLAADILVALHPNLFQAHLARTRALTMLQLWEAAVQEIAVVRRLQPSLQLLPAYEQEIITAAAKDAAAAQGTRSPHSDSGDGRGAAAGSDDDRALDSWANIVRALGHREIAPFVIFDAVVCSCFIALYTYLCKAKAATTKATKSTVVPIAAPPPIPPAVGVRRMRP